MHEAVRNMMKRYACRTRDDYINALREIMQELALLGLWRGKFFEHAAFYGGTALRILYGLDRFSEDLDFSLLRPNANFTLTAYGASLKREIEAFGFHVDFQRKDNTRSTAIESAFLKTNTLCQLIVIEADREFASDIHPEKVLKIKLEVDTNPPEGFETETRYVLQPIPFAVRAYCQPDLFAGKIHALLCRKWKTRVKGRDWYDLVWYVGRKIPVHLNHLQARLRHSATIPDDTSLVKERVIEMMKAAVDMLNVDNARAEVSPFVRDQRSLDVWSRDFFHQVIEQIEMIPD